jgi:predicted transcriptional regulator
MNFNIYLDNEIGAALKRLAKRQKLTRNALIRKAVAELIDKETHAQGWSEAVLQWHGDAEFAAFESHRAMLAETPPDPFA